LLGQVSRRPASPGQLKSPGQFKISSALATLTRLYAEWSSKPGALPDPDKALRHPEGLAGPCTDMRVPTLLAAYAKGLYPAEGKWWAPAERMVSFPENAYVSKTVWRLMQTRVYRVSFDEDFAAVIRACAAAPEMVESFTALHEAGHAHSVEVWDRSGRLAGGLYGVAVGRAFFTEKMFSRERDAANVGFVTLSCHLQHWGFAVNDGKRMSGQLSQLGFMLVPRFAFNGLLSKAARESGREGPWTVDETLDAARWNPKVAGTGKVTPGAAARADAFTLSS
jgi:leucyl/phenylalanyl-tRNA--protein transferase